MALLDDLDVTKPDGATETIPVLDNYIRELKSLLKAWATIEHHTGTGFHKFPSGDTATRPAFGNAGRLYINTETKTIQRDTGAAWEDIVHYYQRYKVGTYTGTASPTLAITGVGFPPTYVQVLPMTGTNPAFAKTVDFGISDSHKFSDNTTDTDGIDSLDADGFTVHANANVNGVAYGYLAIRDRP